MTKALLMALVLCASNSFALNFTANLDAGRLRGPLGQSALPTDGLLVLVAAGGDSTFSNNLATGQVVSANDILLGVAAFNMNFGTDETSSVFNIVNTAAAANDLVGLRWFPDLTLAQYNAGATPVALSNYGTYSPRVSNLTNLTLPNPDAPDGGSSWIVPGSGTVALNFYTTDSDGGGTQAAAEGYASFTVAAAPEPSTWVALTAGGLVFVGFALRRRVRD